MTTSGLKFLSCCISVCFPLFLQSQSHTISVALKKNLAAEPIGNEQFYYYPKMSHLAGIPEDLDTMMFWVCPLSWAQFIYEQYQYGKFYERFDDTPFTKEGYEKFKISREDVTDKPLKYKIYGVSGLRKEKKIIVVDANNNGDLSDEIVMEFDTTGLDIDERVAYSKLTPTLLIHYEVFRNGEIHQKEKIVSIRPFVKLVNPPSRIFEDLKFKIMTNEIFSGELEVKGTKYNLVVDGFIDEEEGKRPRILITEYGFSQDTLKQQIYATIGSMVRIGGTWIRIDTVDFEQHQLQLTLLENYEHKDTVLMAPLISMKDLNNKDFSLEKLKGKYVFMIFWGTWCGPCKADHPALKKLYEQYKNQNVEFVGVAADASPDIVKNYLSKENMNWTNLYVSLSDRSKESVAEQYNVTGFPSYFIINPAGELVFTGNLKNVEAELKQIFE